MAMFMMIICCFIGKKLVNHIMCLNCITNYVIAIISIIAYSFNNNYLDLAIIYGIASFGVTGFLLKIKQNK